MDRRSRDPKLSGASVGVYTATKGQKERRQKMLEIFLAVGDVDKAVDVLVNETVENVQPHEQESNKDWMTDQQVYDIYGKEKGDRLIADAKKDFKSKLLSLKLAWL